MWEPSDNAHTQVGAKATQDSAAVSFPCIRNYGDIVLSETRIGQGPLILFTLTQILLLPFTASICKFGVLYPAVSGLLIGNTIFNLVEISHSAPNITSINL